MLAEIFKKLDGGSLLKIPKVCQRWKYIFEYFETPKIWRKICEDEIDEDVLAEIIYKSHGQIWKHIYWCWYNFKHHPTGWKLQSIKKQNISKFEDIINISNGMIFTLKSSPYKPTFMYIYDIDSNKLLDSMTFEKNYEQLDFKILKVDNKSFVILRKFPEGRIKIFNINENKKIEEIASKINLNEMVWNLAAYNEYLAVLTFSKCFIYKCYLNADNTLSFNEVCRNYEIKYEISFWGYNFVYLQDSKIFMINLKSSLFEVKIYEVVNLPENSFRYNLESINSNMFLYDQNHKTFMLRKSNDVYVCQNITKFRTLFGSFCHSFALRISNQKSEIEFTSIDYNQLEYKIEEILKNNKKLKKANNLCDGIQMFFQRNELKIIYRDENNIYIQTYSHINPTH